MNALSTFTFTPGMDLRTITQDGEPWFIAADVCEVLGLKRDANNGSLQNHMRRLPAKDVMTVVVPSGLNTRKQYIVSEAGLYKLVMRSDKPGAVAFQDWVTSVVLPAIRKDGMYLKGEEKVATGELSIEEMTLKVMSALTEKVGRLQLERDQAEANCWASWSPGTSESLRG
jgi:prophage antirepressor-like protein